MTAAPNAQFNLAKPDSLAIRTATRMRRRMFAMFMDEFRPTSKDTVLDLGVTSDQSYEHSNYFEALYPHKERIVAAGLQDASFLEVLYPGVRYVEADALRLPFADGSFDLVHSAAVIEHVGSLANQATMIAEALRVARRGVCITTPNRWFPIEFHTVTPLIHWLPKPACRAIFRRLGFGPLAEESTLNLMTEGELRSTTAGFPDWHFIFAGTRLWGWKSNLILFAHRS
jgi:ubiquinone/menaquinone biosynthesis C-methylase UbiE